MDNSTFRVLEVQMFHREDESLIYGPYLLSYPMDISIFPI